MKILLFFLMSVSSDKKYNLSRFLEAQEGDYPRALKEIRNGRKSSCWMWYIFPQIQGLGVTSTTDYYSIKDLNEAKEYMNNEILRGRLIEISEALLGLETNDPHAVLGYPDDLKLKSCMTLFGIAAPDQDVFQKVLDKYYNGERDEKTIEKLKGQI